MKKRMVGFGIVLTLSLVTWMMGPDWRRLIASAPTNADVLFWSNEQRDAGFRMLDKVPFLIEARTIQTA